MSQLNFITPWVPSDYFNVIIPPYNLIISIVVFESHCVELVNKLIFANDFLTVASLHGTVCPVSSLIQSMLLCSTPSDV